MYLRAVTWGENERDFLQGPLMQSLLIVYKESPILNFGSMADG